MKKSNVLNALLLGAGVLTMAPSVFAVDDYSGITGAVSVAGLAVALIAMGALKAGPNVAKWGANKLASFFK